jgi:hypothetical protein
MFKTILPVLVVLIVFYYVVKWLMLSKHEIFTEANRIKYVMYDSDKEYIKKFSKQMTDLPPTTPGVFYTETKWKSNNNNYCFFKGKYYIIEPGYYYVYTPEAVYHIDKIKILFLEKNTS